MPADVSAILDRGTQLLQVLGSFWSLVYGDADGVRNLLAARAEAQLQCRQDLLALSACAGLATTPLYRDVRWLPVPIVQSQRLPDTRLSYQSDEALGPAAGSFLSTKTYDYPLPAHLKLAPLIVDRVSHPSLLLVSDVDYHLDATLGAIRFRDDPLTNPNLRTIVSPGPAGTPVDQSLTLWAFEASVDAGWLDQQYASALGLSLGSSEPARTLTAAARAAGMLGPSFLYLEEALSAVCDAPLSEVDGEVVEFAGFDQDRLLVVTSAKIYTLGHGANCLVAAGQTLAVGTRLCDAFQVLDLSHGAPAQLASLAVPASLFQIALTGPLTWSNSIQPTTVTTVSGRTEITWPLGGNPTDVTLFWNTVQSRGTAVGATSLARLLDLRPRPQSTDPDITSLPTTINPLDWLCRNVLGYHACAVLIRPASFGPNALGQGLINTALRQVVPPQALALVVTVS